MGRSTFFIGAMYLQEHGQAVSSNSHSYQAPTGLTDSDDDGGSNGPSFSIKAPTGYSGAAYSITASRNLAMKTNVDKKRGEKYGDATVSIP